MSRRRQDVMPGVLELDLDAIDPIAGVICGVRPWALHEGDSLDLRLPPECADAWIQDPPAGISFMGRAWDGDKGGEAQWIEWAARLFKVAFDALKPGAHGAVWALPRTADWTMQALRRAGFDIFDTLSHLFASGFPKSLSISAAIEARGGDGSRFAGYGTALKPSHECWVLVRKPLIGTYAANVIAHGTGGINVDAGRVGSDTARGERYGGRGPGGGGSITSGSTFSEPWATPPGRWPSNTVFSHASWDESACAACGLTMPFAASFCPACGGGVEVRRAGCRCVGERRVRGSGPITGGVLGYGGGVAGGAAHPGHADADGLETVAAWECLATCDRCGESALVPSGGDAGPCAGCGALRRWACPVARLDEQSGERPSGGRVSGVRKGMGYHGATGGDGGPGIEASDGNASRFFHCFPPDPSEPFWFSAKPSTSEREAGCDALPKKSAGDLVDREDGSAGTQSPRAGAGRTSGGRANHHPTVKGFHLIGHLCDLLVPPGGLVLDLTAGSGTLGAVVAHRHHVTEWRAILGEMDPGYCAIIRARCKHWGARPWKPRRASTKAVPPRVDQGDLFAAAEALGGVACTSCGRLRIPDDDRGRCVGCAVTEGLRAPRPA